MCMPWKTCQRIRFNFLYYFFAANCWYCICNWPICISRDKNQYFALFFFTVTSIIPLVSWSLIFVLIHWVESRHAYYKNYMLARQIWLLGTTNNTTTGYLHFARDQIKSVLDIGGSFALVLLDQDGANKFINVAVFIQMLKFLHMCTFNICIVLDMTLLLLLSLQCWQVRFLAVVILNVVLTRSLGKALYSVVSVQLIKPWGEGSIYEYLFVTIGKPLTRLRV